MSDFPTANFSGTDDGLFTVAEIRQLMAAEFDRALRYQYPLVFMAIGVDRIDHLKDLYGFESKAVILRSVTDLLQSVSRTADFLGCLVEDRILTLFPYTPPAGAAAIANRLLSGARELKFDGDGHTLQVTLSVGASHNQTSTPLSYEDMIRTGEAALAEARGGGGDRYLVREPKLLSPESAPIPLPVPSPVTPAPAPPAAPPQAPPLSSPDPRQEGELFERLRDFLSEHTIAKPDVRGMEKEILDSVLKVLRDEREKSREQREAKAPDPHAEQIELMHRRISKLSGMLDRTEGELRRLAGKSTQADQGIASIYDEVQGIADDENDSDLKKEMMAQIFQANLDLKVRSGL